jgi:hypothetical protein
MASVSSLHRHTCPKCSPTVEVLFDARRCVLCGYEPRKRNKRRHPDAVPAWTLKRAAHKTAANRPSAKNGT